ncbi:MAG: molybdopterin molybdotransferase MoeA [Acidimicrobiaceae bacterium]|nr:molybdopterin molybdotransferase MoeA [Acidimicrobiaceae bacterium]MYA74481.1 molybdopterin molybdotransferase MoeA [Acidimicrobiaceae bacterium]MYC43876.1 molybdopterin molybdotransferase MoeA [Acidimicrobiaceae bacterium]MYJ99419.1 molybdopterin molybdotransferase MoeA [Acidimicrobiaceae bacterium]
MASGPALGHALGVIPLDEARSYVLDRVDRLPAVQVSVAEAAGLVLAEPIVAQELVPPFANTAMDGFAVIAADTDSAPVTLEVAGTVAAGAPATRPLGPGQAMRIMTGAPMPEGADAVVMVERTSYDADNALVDVEISVGEGNHVREAGEDVRPGDELFGAGTVLAAGHLGVLASVGIGSVCAYRRPIVGVVSTGDELVDDGRPLKPGEIRDSNRRTLLTMLDESGMEPVDLGIARDNEADIAEAFTEGAARCDAILSSGGVSMGAFDYVKVVLDRLGDMRWMQIAIKPAKPFAFGLIGTTPVFGLPGNPVSSMVSYELFARPALRKMAGHTLFDRPVRRAISEDPIGRHDDGKTHYIRVTGGPDETGRWHVRKLTGQGSHQLTAMARASALAVVPDQVEIAAGDEVEIIGLGTVVS